MSNVRSKAIAGDIACPFEFRGIGVTSSNIAGLELLELLLGAKFIGLDGISG
jgi:hypothetical protein